MFQIVQNAIHLLFAQGELAQLSHSSFHEAIQTISTSTEEEFTISYPVGYKPSKESILTSHPYSKEGLTGRYNYLMHTQLPVSGIFQLSMVMEVLFSSLIRELVLEFPEKLSSKKLVPVSDILKAATLVEIHLSITDKLLTELSYKSPREFAEEAETYLSVNLLECAAYHAYIEMKATRDILIHNFGVANDTYISKAGTHARVRTGQELPVSQVYFLEAYESCLQVCEWLEEQLHRKWHSSDYAVKKSKNAGT